jgi:2-C-methyl-D-erythritol 4-phosphate cytidylyltransferase
MVIGTKLVLAAVKVVVARGAITGVPVADAHPAKVAAKRPYSALGFMLKRVLLIDEGQDRNQRIRAAVQRIKKINEGTYDGVDSASYNKYQG